MRVPLKIDESLWEQIMLYVMRYDVQTSPFAITLSLSKSLWQLFSNSQQRKQNKIAAAN